MNTGSRETMKATKIAFATAVVIVSTCLAAQTHATIVPVPDVGAGNQYRLVFTTSAYVYGNLTLGEYDTFVQGLISSVSSLDALGGTWQALVSVGATDAKTHTDTDETTDTGVPIYLVDGNKVADDYNDLWDETLDHPIDWAENDAVLDDSNECFLWTGTAPDGTVSSEGALGVGDDEGAAGLWDAIDYEWMYCYHWDKGFELPIYGISSVFTAGGGGAIPEPSTLLLLLGAAGLFACARRRRR